MIVDKANAANIYAVTREQVPGEKSGPPERKTDSGGGLAGDAGPAVVAELSAAALASSRAVKTSEEVSDQSGTGRGDDQKPGRSSGKPLSPVDIIV
ncbi:MAG: hypothetical protein KKG47_16175 [Proteobacteria bacterium]|nr:hypothetical protein [Pseudomonadota bacterium]MBU1739614.1 hypothetical protein [Pseudomonadota bacterium]